MLGPCLPDAIIALTLAAWTLLSTHSTVNAGRIADWNCSTTDASNLYPAQRLPGV